MDAANQLLQIVVYITQACPKSASDWKTASDNLGCHFDSPDIKNRYHCVPNEDRSMLLEFCYNRARTLVKRGYCLEITKSGSLNFVKCTDLFSYGCPTKEYYSDEIYNNSACLDINTHQKCFVANQECEKPWPTSPRSVQEQNTYFSRQEKKSERSSTSVIIVLGTLLGLVLFGIILTLIIKRKDIPTYIRNLIGHDNQEEVTTEQQQEQPSTPFSQSMSIENENKESEASTAEKKPLLPDVMAEETSPKQLPEVKYKKEVIDKVTTEQQQKQPSTPVSQSMSIENENEASTAEKKPLLPDVMAEETSPKQLPEVKYKKEVIDKVTTEQQQEQPSTPVSQSVSIENDAIAEETSPKQLPEVKHKKEVIEKDVQDARREVDQLELVTTFTTAPINEDESVVAAIDLGTTYSGYCFSSKEDYHINPLKMYTHKWTFSWIQAVSLKTPTAILLDKDKKFKSFGFDAETEYAEMDKGSHEDHYYFQRFKMALNDIEKNKAMNIKDVRGQELSATHVFSECIRHLKDQLLERLDRSSLNNIYWVLTYPSLWDIDKQRVLKDSAIKAGIPSANVVITEEALVVSYYLHHLPYCLKDSNIFVEGKKYLLLDAGGGTVDITINEIQLDRTSRTLTKRSCPYGGTTVDRAFEIIIRDIIGEDLMAQFIQRHTSDYIEMLRNFEVVKRKSLGNQVEKVLLRIPITLTQIYEEKHGHFIGERIKQTSYDGKLTWEDDKFRMTKRFFTSLFDEAFTGIKSVIQDLLKEHEAKDTKTILMVGGFSESSQLHQMIHDEFMDFDVINLPEPGLAVLRGAVLYGHQPVVFHPSLRLGQYIKSP